MKRMWIFVCLALLAMAITATAQEAQQPSLADAARAARAQKKKPAAKLVFDNDTIPRSGELSVVGKQTDAPKKESPLAEANADKDAADKGAADAVTKQIEDKKKEISDLQKEIDLLQREHKLKQTMGYVDIGTKLRDQKKWEDDEKKFTADVADRNKKLADAQNQLTQLVTLQKSAASGQ
jgi:hypothetical protein